MQRTKDTRQVNSGPNDAEPFIVRHAAAASLVILVIAGVNLAVQWLARQWYPSYVGSELVFSLLAVYMPLVAAFLYQRTRLLLPVVQGMVDLPSERITPWFRKQEGFIFGGMAIYVVAIACALTGTVRMYSLGIPWRGFVLVVFLILAVALFAATGAVGWIYLGLLLLLRQLAAFDIRAAYFEWSEAECKQLHRADLHMFMAGVVIYLGAVIASWISPGGQYLVMSSTLGRLWIFSVAGAVVAFFLACQYSIHQIMARAKQRRVDEMSKLLEQFFAEWRADPSGDKGKTISDLLDWRDRVPREHDWPLDLTGTLAVVGGLLLPTVNTIVDLIAK